jgi:hypothetical protein
MSSIARRLDRLEHALELAAAGPCPHCPPNQVRIRLVTHDEHPMPETCHGCGRPVPGFDLVDPFSVQKGHTRDHDGCPGCGAELDR